MAKEHEYPFFTNRECKYFPCHDDWDPDDFNCLFCYCPLYALGPACEGRYRITKKGVKDCTHCSLPHQGDAGTKLVKAHFPQLVELTKARMGAEGDVAAADAAAAGGAADGAATDTAAADGAQKEEGR